MREKVLGRVGTTTIAGTYRLAEDTSFGPRVDDDCFLPFFSRGADFDPAMYPPAAYYLGFFEAVTVDADVHIDLNDHVLEQSKEFHLLQRFFNAIELGDRRFVQNNGVSSLKYQATDRPLPS